MALYSDLQGLAKIVNDNQGIVTTTMRKLRDAYGADRLGKHVRSGLSDKLAEMGLKHTPSELPDSQEVPIRIYRSGSPVAKIIQASHKVSDENDQILRDAAANESTELLQKVKELVCG